MKVKKLLGLVAAFALLIGVNAHALDYAVSYLNVFDNTAVFDNPDALATAPNNTSQNTAVLLGSGPVSDDIGIGLRDAPVAVDPDSDVNRTENYYYTIGRSGNYSHGDSFIDSSSAGSGYIFNNAQAMHIAEGNLADIGKGSSNAWTSSISLLEISAPTKVTFSFKAHPYMEVYLAPNLELGTKSEAKLETSITILVANTNENIFEWYPNGSPGNVKNGIEISDPFTLNTSEERLTPGTRIYDPTGQTATGVGTATPGPGDYGEFSVETTLQPGTYTVKFESKVSESRILLSDGTGPGRCRMTGGSVTDNYFLNEEGGMVTTYEYVEGTYAEANPIKGQGTLKKIDFSDGQRTWVTTGGQIGAPSIDPATGHWTHTQHAGAEGLFTFLSGTASAPPGTEISNISCADEGWCVQARCAPFKQIFWDGIGYFPNKHGGDEFNANFDNCPTLTPGGPQKDGSLHYYRAMVGDFGENDRKSRQISQDECEWLKPVPEGAGGPSGFDVSQVVELDSMINEQFGDKGGQDCDKCPDYYQIEVHCTSDPNSPVIYLFSDFIDGGNFQIHPETSEQCTVYP